MEKYQISFKFAVFSLSAVSSMPHTYATQLATSTSRTLTCIAAAALCVRECFTKVGEKCSDQTWILGGQKGGWRIG